MPTPPLAPLSTLRHAAAAFLAGGGLAAGASVALLLRLLPADLPGARISGHDLLVLLAWGLAAGLGYWLAGRRLLTLVAAAEPGVSPADAAAVPSARRWAAHRLALASLVRGLLRWPLFAALVLLLRPPLSWALEASAVASLVGPLDGLSLETGGTVLLGLALAAVLGRAEGRAAARRTLRLLGAAAR